MAASADPVVLRHRDLEKIANVALKVGRVLMECGGRVSVVREGMRLAAQGLGAKVVGERVGYASLTLTVGAGEETITRMIDVGPHGVNYQLDVAVRRFATTVAREGGTPTSVLSPPPFPALPASIPRRNTSRFRPTPQIE